MLVQVLPLEFAYGEHLLLWKRNAKRGTLIDWSLATVYFRPTENSLNMTGDQEVWATHAPPAHHRNR